MSKQDIEGAVLELDAMLEKWNGDPSDILDDVRALRDRLRNLLSMTPDTPTD